MPKQDDLIDLFSKDWEEKCRDALQKCSELDGQKIPESEKWWRVKQLLTELVRKERRERPRPQQKKNEPFIENKAFKERRKLDFHSSEWMEKCERMKEKCAEIEKAEIPPSEKVWRTRQLLKDLVFVDTKRKIIKR